jgi:hypothetical protein
VGAESIQQQANSKQPAGKGKILLASCRRGTEHLLSATVYPHEIGGFAKNSTLLAMLILKKCI